jgi:C-terminal processing protease CtpA/Prc
MRPILIASALALLTALCPPLAASDTTPKSLADQAADAYAARAYEKSAQLFVAAAEQGEDTAGSLYNAACSFALAGEPDEAISALERAVAAGFEDVEHAKEDADLVSLHGDARWQPLLDRAIASAKVYRDFWDGPSMQTPFRENLSDDEKVAGLSKLWAEAKFNFVHFDKVPGLNWDAVYMEYLQKVRATKSTFEYYRLLIQMYARLQDGHTGVWMPKELMDENFARPLLRTAFVEGKVMIVAVAKQLAATGLTPGLEIVGIDGVRVADYVERNVIPYESASTRQDLLARVYGRGLLEGPKSKPVELTLLDASGKTTKRSVPRAPNADYWTALGTDLMAFTMLPGDVAYVKMDSFNDSKAADLFEAAFPEIAKAKALVIDVRENGGGNSDVGYRVLACLTDREFLGSKWETRDYRPVYRAWGQRETRFHGPVRKVPPNGKLLFTNPVVVLTSPRTYSAAEDFTVAFHGMKRGEIVGETTGGSTGQPLTFPLPGGGAARVCTKHDAFADGTEFVGTGVVPDVTVRPTVADLRAGRDTVLQAALRELKRAGIRSKP